MKCKNCGKPLQNGANFCPYCGTPVTPEEETTPPAVEEVDAVDPIDVAFGTPPPQYVFQSFLTRLRVSGILLLINGILQGIVALCLLAWAIVCNVAVAHYLPYTAYYYGDFNLYQYGYYGADYSGAGVALVVVLYIVTAGCIAMTLINLISAGKFLAGCKQYRQNPAGITQRYSHLGFPIFLLIINILFGGILGIIGGIFAILANSVVRSQYPVFRQL